MPSSSAQGWSPAHPGPTTKQIWTGDRDQEDESSDGLVTEKEIHYIKRESPEGSDGWFLYRVVLGVALERK